jgi:hypothetical protein
VDDETTEPGTPEPAPVTKKTPVPTDVPATKVAPIVADAAEPPDVHDVQVSLGPFFSLGALLVIIGVLRRRPLALVAGLAAIWVDQRSAFGQRLKERIRARARR